jgi:hypothetical protein
MQKIANPPGSASYLEMARAVASSIGRWRVLDARSNSQPAGSLMAAAMAERARGRRP